MAADPDRHLEAVLATRIREIAERRRLPLTHLADRAAISRSQLWSVLSGEHSATLALIQKLALVLEVSPLDLLAGDSAVSLREPRKRPSRARPEGEATLAANSKGARKASTSRTKTKKSKS